MERIKVLLVDQNVLFRHGVALQLSKEPDIELVGDTGDAQEAFSTVKATLPNVVVIDTKLSPLGGFELAARIRRCFPASCVITLSDDDSDEELYRAIKAGSAAHFAKKALAALLLTAIRKAARGEYPINESLLAKPKVASKVLDEFQSFSLTIDQKPESLHVPLSTREIEILPHVARGNPNKRIAHALGIKEQGVKNCVSDILRKLAANDRAHAVYLALKYGWLDLE